ncbi:MAG: hypothetical protein AAGE52_01730 [Myxococcota bacterium]
MKRFALLLSMGLLAVSCGDGGGKLFADARWQVRCPPGLPMCSRNGDVVDLFAFDGDEGINVSCSATESGEDARIINFTVARGSQPQLSVTGLLTGINGGTVRGESCRVTVLDDGNAYGGTTEGRCGANPPSEAQPCQIGAIEFDEEPETGDPRLSTTIECRNLRAPSNPELLQRDVTFPMMATMPATIGILNCDGI